MVENQNTVATILNTRDLIDGIYDNLTDEQRELIDLLVELRIADRTTAAATETATTSAEEPASVDVVDPDSTTNKPDVNNQGEISVPPVLENQPDTVVSEDNDDDEAEDVTEDDDAITNGEDETVRMPVEIRVNVDISSQSDTSIQNEISVPSVLENQPYAVVGEDDNNEDEAEDATVGDNTADNGEDETAHGPVEIRSVPTRPTVDEERARLHEEARRQEEAGLREMARRRGAATRRSENASLPMPWLVAARETAIREAAVREAALRKAALRRAALRDAKRRKAKIHDAAKAPRMPQVVKVEPGPL